jgi:hypothetical protein
VGGGVDGWVDGIVDGIGEAIGAAEDEETVLGIDDGLGFGFAKPGGSRVLLTVVSTAGIDSDSATCSSALVTPILLGDAVVGVGIAPLLGRRNFPLPLIGIILATFRSTREAQFFMRESTMRGIEEMIFCFFRQSFLLLSTMSKF